MKNRWGREVESTIPEWLVPIFPTKSYIIRHLPLILFELFLLCGMRIDLLWFISNCLNIICGKEKNPTSSTTVLSCTLIKNQLSWPLVIVQWLCGEYPHSPGFRLQHPKGRKTMTHECADSFLGPRFYLAIQLYASSVLFLLILLCSKFWKSEAGVFKLCSLSRFFQPVSCEF